MLKPNHKPSVAETLVLGALLVVVAAALSALLLSVSVAALGQSSTDFSLFEPIGPTSDVVGSAPSRRNSVRRPGLSGTEAEFSLIGTSRIGTTTSVILKHLSGKSLRVPMQRQRMTVPGYEQYVVIGVDSNSVSIQYPQSVSCADFAAEGFSCDATRNVVMLSLTVDDADLSRVEQNETQLQGSRFEQQEADGVPINPFEALRDRSQNSELATGQPDRFQPRRIDPVDVPPGMRVLSTPFGDRLVEE